MTDITPPNTPPNNYTRSILIPNAPKKKGPRNKTIEKVINEIHKSDNERNIKKELLSDLGIPEDIVQYNILLQENSIKERLKF